MEPIDLMSAPVPGQSLTQPPGNANWENPPQFVDPAIALEYVWETITKPRKAFQISVLLKKGMPAEYIARTLVFTGFSAGKWSADLALLISRPVLYQIVAVGALQKVKNIKIFNDRQDPMAAVFEESDFAPDEEEVEVDEEDDDMEEGEEEEEDEEEDMTEKKGLLD